MKTSQSRLEINKRWRTRNREYLREYHRRWRAAHRDRNRAHKAVARAVKSGRLVRPELCQGCGELPPAGTALNGHHHRGYEDRLVVKWVCVSCHALAHPDRH